MSFTDDDLKRLKASFEKPEYHEDVAADVAFWILNSQPALLHRLEAAEAVASLVGFVATSADRQHKLLDAWRKSKGL